MSPNRFVDADADDRLDVREVSGQPFDAITSALDDLTHDESLLLISSFEPEPLYGVLERRGFEYETSNPLPGEWHVEITRA
jgi:uncharacterized protein (DUF2249 family)